ncbi:class I SAM-dependent methyltransferase [Escherichia coli]
MVAHVFHSVASKYDVMNDLMSFGIHPFVEAIHY